MQWYDVAGFWVGLVGGITGVGGLVTGVPKEFTWSISQTPQAPRLGRYETPTT